MYGSARLWICVLVLLALVWWPGGIVEAREQSAALNGTVEAGKTYAVRLRNLPKGAVLAIKLKTSDSVVVWLLSEDSFKKFPSVEKPLFRGDTSGKLEFSLLIPESSHYFIVLDNRDHKKDREFSLGIKAAAE
jgi:hypothetical protein